MLANIDARRDAHEPDARAEPAEPQVRCLDSRMVFEGRREVRIAHAGQEYRLRQTRNGKLILTK
jgi:hemin uptake protein HemP